MSLAQSQLKKITVQPIGYCQSCTLEVRSAGVTARQSYDNINKLFAPDYSLNHLQIFPRCIIVDPDSPTASKSVNEELSDVTWWEVTPNGKTLICKISNSDSSSTSTSTTKDGYKVTGTGANKGELEVSSNGTVGVPRTLRFKANWIDIQSNYCYTFIKDIALTIEDASEPIPELVVDIPKTYQWNPFRNPSTYTASAKLFVGKVNMVDDARCKLFWYRIESNGAKNLISTETDAKTLEISSLTKNKNSQITAIQLNLDLVEDSSYEVVASFRSKGALPTEPSESDPRYQFCVSRSYPAMSAEFRGKNLSVNQSTKSIMLSAIIKDNMDVVPDWDRYACAYWYSVKSWVDQNNVMQQSKTLLGTGDEIEVPTKEQNFIQLSLEDRGAYKPVVDGNSAYLVSDDGKYIIMNDIA